MQSIIRPLALFIFSCVLLAPQFTRGAEEGQRDGRFERRWTRDWSAHSTNHASVKSAFREAISEASAATVRILSDGKPAALGVALDDRGHVVTKASDLLGELTCRIGEGDVRPARLVGFDETHDLALVKTDAAGLEPAGWRTEDLPPPGSLIASVAPAGELLSVGVVSSGLRKIAGPTQPEGRRGWLGIVLGGGEGGLGITNVMHGSAAAKAGVEPGDRIVRIDEITMKDFEQVVDTVRANPPGQTVRLVVRRDGEEKQLSATLGKPRTRPSAQDHWGGGPFSARRSGFPAVLPHDSVIHPNECGSPLVDTDGRIVGINIARALRVATYALPADVVLEVSQKLLAGR